MCPSCSSEAVVMLPVFWPVVHDVTSCAGMAYVCVVCVSEGVDRTGSSCNGLPDVCCLTHSHRTNDRADWRLQQVDNIVPVQSESEFLQLLLGDKCNHCCWQICFLSLIYLAHDRRWRMEVNGASLVIRLFLTSVASHPKYKTCSRRHLY